MSRRSQVVQARKALQNAPPPVQKPQQQQITIEGLVPFLMQQGAQVGVALQLNDEDKALRIVAVCGPIKIPVDLTDFAKAREIGNAILDACDKYDPAAEETALKGDYDVEDDDDLLAESMARMTRFPATDFGDQQTQIFDGRGLPQLPAPEPSRLILPSC